MNDIEHNFVDTISSERILQWRAAVQELINVAFAMEFILDHLREISQAFFMKKVQPAVDAIDTRIETLKKEVADFEGRRERLLVSIGGSNCFRDQPLISRLIDVVFLFFFSILFLLLLPHLVHFIYILSFYSTYLANLT